MKKGLLALMVVALLLVGMVAYSAAPEMWGIPDIIIGDAEDLGFTDNFFIFTDAFAFDDYFHWITDGAKSLKWHFLNCDPEDQLEINRQLADVTGVANIAGGGFTTASFRNVALSPHGGPFTLNPVGFLGSTDAAFVTLQVDNFLVVDDQDVAVFTVDGGTDALTSEYYKVDQVSVVMTSDPGWDWFAFTVGVIPGTPYGVTPAIEAYNATSDALTITSTGTDNNFGYWSPPTDVPWLPGQSYMAVCEVFGDPVVDEANAANWRRFIPGLRLRMNARNETIASSLTVLSEGFGTVGLTHDDQNAGTECMIFDPRDHSAVDASLQYLYFSFDMMEFAALNRSYPGELDDEGTLGLKSIDIATFPTKMLWRESTMLKAWPEGDTFADDFTTDFTTVENGFGGTPPTVSTNLAGDIQLTSLNVSAGYALCILNQSGGALMDDGADYYAVRFMLKSNNKNANWVRMRVFDNQGQRNADVNLYDYYSGYQLPGAGGATYNVFLSAKRPEYDTMYLLYAVDLIDFNETGGNTEVTFTSAYAYGAPYPDVAP
jgi:hypothetical protein